MNILSNIVIDGISLVILLIIFWYSVFYNKINLEQKLFYVLMINSFIIVIADICMRIFDYSESDFGMNMLKIWTLVFYIVLMLICYIGLVYCDVKVHNGTIEKSKFILYGIPFLISLILNVSSLFTNWIFCFENNNSYMYGEYHFIYVLLIVIYMITSIIIIIYNGRPRHYLEKKDIYLLLFISIPTSTIIVQTMYYEVSLLTIGIALGLLIVFIERLAQLITIDNLTEINNRYPFLRYVASKINMNTDELFFALIIDVDKFKLINDNLGHIKGDEALKIVTSILKQSCERSDCIARLGGDEFGVAGIRQIETDIQKLIEEIQEAIERQNSKKELPYELSISIGHAIYDKENHNSVEIFLDSADTNMYEAKRGK